MRKGNLVRIMIAGVLALLGWSALLHSQEPELPTPAPVMAPPPTAPPLPVTPVETVPPPAAPHETPAEKVIPPGEAVREDTKLAPAPVGSMPTRAPFKRMTEASNADDSDGSHPAVKLPAFRVVAVPPPKESPALREPAPTQPAPTLPAPTESTSLKPAMVGQEQPPAPATKVPGSAQTPALVLEKIGPGAVKANQPFTYLIVVRNVGAVTATWARLDDQLPPGSRLVSGEPPPEAINDHLAWVIQDLPPGAERSFKVQVQSQTTQELRGNATLTVTATTSSPPARPVQPAPIPSPPRAEAPRPRLEVTLTGPGTVNLGQKAAFTIRVANHSTAAVKGLSLKATLPPGLEHPYGQGSAIECEIAQVPAGETATVNLECKATQPGRQVLPLIVSSSSGIQVRTEAVVVVDALAAAPNRTPPLNINPQR